MGRARFFFCLAASVGACCGSMGCKGTTPETPSVRAEPTVAEAHDPPVLSSNAPVDVRCGDEPWCSGDTPHCAKIEERWQCVREAAPSFQCAHESHCSNGRVCCVASVGSYCAEASECSVLAWQSFPCRELGDCPVAPVISDDGTMPMGKLHECGPLEQGPPDLRVCRFGDASGAWP
jgi:hypothetical protein